MNLKSLLKNLKYYESSISMILGVIIIIVVGILIVNYFSANKGETIPSMQITNQSLPATYVVAKGDDLWKISEKYYGTGYSWTKIAKANNITNANQIEAGQILNIPVIEDNTDQKSTPIQSVTPTEKLSPSPIEKPTYPEYTDKINNIIKDNTYTVEKGDTLWSIAVRSYGDGYKWVDIARVNKLLNPNLIHRGNIFIIPR